MDEKIKHLEMIQGVINRMANNSFLLKGWSVVLVSALFALAAKDLNSYFIFLACFPALAFWSLDGFFLWQERLFRKLYDRVRKMDETEIDFSMDTSIVLDEVDPWYKVTNSKTLRRFHGIIVGVILFAAIAIWIFSYFEGS